MELNCFIHFLNVLLLPLCFKTFTIYISLSVTPVMEIFYVMASQGVNRVCLMFRKVQTWDAQVKKHVSIKNRYLPKVLKTVELTVI